MASATESANRAQTAVRLTLRDNEEALRLFGHGDIHLRRIEEHFPVRVVARGNDITVKGPREDVERVAALVEQLLRILREGKSLTSADVETAVRMAGEGNGHRVDEVFSDSLLVTARGRNIRPKTAGQKRYVEAIRSHGLTFAIGPAGTGKTYLAVVMAMAALREGSIQRVVLTRPIVEAGEKLGFLPGDLQEKVDPYLRPLYDAMYDMVGVEAFQKFFDRGAIELAPLAYMRGRTLDDAFIILDEAQNTTPEQMKMFLTRMGFGSKAVVTGDITQVDLPPQRISGLLQARRVLQNVQGIAFVDLTEQDVVRHWLVQRIVQAYDAYESDRPAPSRSRS